MNGSVKYLVRDLDSCRRSSLGEERVFVAKNLRAAALDEKWRESGEIGDGGTDVGMREVLVVVLAEVEAHGIHRLVVVSREVVEVLSETKGKPEILSDDRENAPRCCPRIPDWR